MNRIVIVDLAGGARQFRLHEDAYDALRAYLDTARSRLGADPDAAEIVADLERAIGERLSALPGPDDRIIGADEVSAVLGEVGTVEVGADAAPHAQAAPAAGGQRPAQRRLFRIREGQSIAGVCTGVAAYADLDLRWVRTIVVLLTIFSAGIFGLVYLLMAVVLPVIDTRAAWVAAMGGGRPDAG